MKKIIYVFAISCLVLTFSACEGPPVILGSPGYPSEAEVLELKNIDFNKKFTIYRKLIPKIKLGDVLLVYRLSATIDPITPVWQPIPRTLYLKDSGDKEQKLDYDFDFSREDFTIYAGGTFDLNSPLGLPYIKDQTFRIVIVPGAMPNEIDVLDYNAVIHFLNIDQNNVQVIDSQ